VLEPGPAAIKGTVMLSETKASASARKRAGLCGSTYTVNQEGC